MENAHSLIDTVMGKFQNSDWSSKEQFAINLALEEAMVNAVQHGNKSDPSKNVHFACRLTNSFAKFRVEDEGDGFDPNAVPDPTDEDHILNVSGRGVLLIKGFVSRVCWNDKGNVLEFEKDRAG
jgi:serine/threonine-protein kinase RsbW